MIDYTTSKIAQMEHEERIRKLAPVHDYDAWLTHTAGIWQAPQMGDLLASLGKALTAIGDRLKRGREAAPHAPLMEKKGHEVLS